MIVDSTTVAKAALTKASLLQRSTEKSYIAGLKLCALCLSPPGSHFSTCTADAAPPCSPPLLNSGAKGYDSKGAALPGREVNLRKRDGVAARKPGDMANCDDTALLARVNAVMRGEQPPGK